jgi:hypothetical protein
MKRFILCLMALLVGLAVFVQTASADPFTRKSHEWTAEQEFKKGVVFGLDHKAKTEFNDDGEISSLSRQEKTPTCVSGSGYTLTSDDIRDYSVFYIDQSPAVGVVNPMSTGNAGIGVSAGVTVTLPVPDANCDKKDFYLIGTDSGGSQFVTYVPGGTMSGGTPVSQSANRTVGSASVTSCTEFLTMDGYYDVLHLRANYNSAVSYEVLDYYNR